MALGQLLEFFSKHFVIQWTGKWGSKLQSACAPDGPEVL